MSSEADEDNGKVRGRGSRAAGRHVNDATGGLEQLQEAIGSKMNSILKTRTLRGCPFNIPFCDVETVMVKVRST